MNSPLNQKQQTNPQINIQKNQLKLKNQIQTSGSDKPSVSKLAIQKNQDSLNNFAAIKKLKETEQQIKMIQGRFKVLKIKQQSVRAKTFHQQKLIQFNQQIQKHQANLRASILKASLERKKEENQQKQKNLKLKEQIKQKNKTVRQTMIQQKVEQNKKLKQQSVENQKKFKQIKAEQRQQKVKKRLLIAVQQKSQKQKLQRYKQQKVNDVKNYKTLGMNSIIQRNSMKQKQLQQLLKMEEDLTKQNQNSIQASRILKIKLQSVIHRRKNKNIQKNQTISFIKNDSTSKLPQIKRVWKQQQKNKQLQ